MLDRLSTLPTDIIEHKLFPKFNLSALSAVYRTNGFFKNTAKNFLEAEKAKAMIPKQIKILEKEIEEKSKKIPGNSLPFHDTEFNLMADKFALLKAIYEKIDQIQNKQTFSEYVENIIEKKLRTYDPVYLMDNVIEGDVKQSIESYYAILPGEDAAKDLFHNLKMRRDAVMELIEERDANAMLCS